MCDWRDQSPRRCARRDNAAWLLAETLRRSGARYEKGANWAAFVVQDGNLISGQNPASTAPLVDAVLAALA